MIRKELEMAFAEAVKEAQKRQHDMLTVEHILYAFLNDNTGREILSGCGADIDVLKAQLENFFAEKMIVYEFVRGWGRRLTLYVRIKTQVYKYPVVLL